MYTYLNKQQAESVLCIGMYTKLTGRRVQVTWPLKLQRFFCYMTAGKHSARIDIPSFQLHLEINLHKMTDPGLNIPALKNESFTSRNMTETMYISFSLKTCSCKWYIQRLIREALSICFECDLRVFVCLFVCLFLYRFKKVHFWRGFSKVVINTHWSYRGVGSVLSPSLKRPKTESFCKLIKYAPILDTLQHR